MDSAVFIAMGEMFLDGKIPYKDFFDHKGFVLIVIEAAGQLFIRGRDEIFILQIANLYFILFFLQS